MNEQCEICKKEPKIAVILMKNRQVSIGKECLKEERFKPYWNEEVPPLDFSLVKMLAFETLYKSDYFWDVLVLLDVFHSIRISRYIFMKKNGEWVKKRKMTLGTEIQWNELKRSVDNIFSRYFSAKRKV